MNGQQLPPEIIILRNKFAEMKNKFKGFAGLGIVLLLLLLVLPSIIYTLEPDQEGVVQRFGKWNRTEGPGGLHFKLPIGIEKVTKVRTQAILKQEFGFQTLRAGVRTEYDRRNIGRFDDESIMLTGDLNVADVEWIVQYKIADPAQYLFKVRNVEANIRDLSESVMRRVVGDRSVTEVLTFGRLDIEEKTRELLQKSLNQYEVGIQVVTVKLQDVNPPEQVKPSFNEVNAAKQESEQMVHEAKTVYNKIIPEAKGKAEQAILSAKGYAQERINQAKGDAERFISMQKEYAKAPSVTRKRLYLETIKKVMGEVENVYVVDPDIKSLVPLLNLSQKGGS